MVETGVRFALRTCCEASYRSLVRALMSKLNFSRKRLGKRCRDRDPVACALWHNNVRSCFTSEQLVCVDESSCDDRTTNRTMGISRRGKRAASRNCFFRRGRRFSIVAPFDMADGFLDSYIVEGGFTAETFLVALRLVVVIAATLPMDWSRHPAQMPRTQLPCVCCRSCLT